MRIVIVAAYQPIYCMDEESRIAYIFNVFLYFGCFSGGILDSGGGGVGG